jgi:ATP-binding protein involved in chromosome partitioning
MIRKLKVQVLGVVENYTGEIFGEGAGAELASEMDLPFLGSLSLRSDYRDTSQPTVLSSPQVMEEYREVAERVKDGLKALARDKE